MAFEEFSPLVIVSIAASLFIISSAWLWVRLQQKSFQLIKALDELSQFKQASEDHTEKSLRHENLLAEKEVEIAKLKAVVEQKEYVLTDYQQKNSELNQIKDHYIELQARLKEKQEQLKSKEELIEDSKNSLLKEFELAANKMFESKQQTFHQSSRQQLDNVLSPFKQQLQEFHKHVEDVYYKENTQRNQLIGQIGELQRQAKKMSEDANNLATALKGDNKVQGQWGEIILERLLEQSGLEKGREYDTQTNFKQDDGKHYRPDVIIHLPEKKDIVVDSKVALVEYERYVSQENPSSKEQHLKSHVDVIRTHIKALSFKRYDNLEGLRTLDFVFLFIPIEAAYVAAVQHTPSLFKEAHDKNIMLVSPSSLMVALRTVETMWRYEKQNANAEKIANSAGKLYDQFVLVMTALEEVGGYLNKAGESYETVFNRISQGRGNVLKRIDDLKKLGAKTTKPLPKATKERLELNEKQIELLIDDDR